MNPLGKDFNLEIQKRSMNLGAWIEMIRPVNVLMTGLGVAVGFFLASRGFPITENLGRAMLSAMIISGAGMMINDYFDRFIDARIKPERPIPSGRVKAWQALVASLVLFGLGVYLAWTINKYTFYIALFAAGLLILYSWILARIPLVGNGVIALNTGLTFIFGEAVTGRIFSVNTSVLFTLAFLSTLSREIYKDVEDMEGDKISRKTLPMIIGKENARFLASVFTVLPVIASPVPYILGTLNLGYLALVSIADIIFIYIAFASVIKSREYTKWMKIAQLLALVAFLIGM